MHADLPGACLLCHHPRPYPRVSPAQAKTSGLDRLIWNVVRCNYVQHYVAHHKHTHNETSDAEVRTLASATAPTAPRQR